MTIDIMKGKTVWRLFALVVLLLQADFALGSTQLHPSEPLACGVENGRKDKECNYQIQGIDENSSFFNGTDQVKRKLADVPVIDTVTIEVITAEMRKAF